MLMTKLLTRERSRLMADKPVNWFRCKDEHCQVKFAVDWNVFYESGAWWFFGTDDEVMCPRCTRRALTNLTERKD